MFCFTLFFFLCLVHRRRNLKYIFCIYVPNIHVQNHYRFLGNYAGLRFLLIWPMFHETFIIRANDCAPVLSALFYEKIYFIVVCMFVFFISWFVFLLVYLFVCLFIYSLLCLSQALMKIISLRVYVLFGDIVFKLL